MIHLPVLSPNGTLLPARRRRQSRDHSATVEVELDNGETYSKFCPAPKGDPANRLTPEQLREKFMRNTTRVLAKPQMKVLYTLLQDIEAIDDVRRMPQMLCA